ncbi:MAG TPA: PIN domain-containing protein, partial [Candidatus Hydrogenedentes bacterium]|nr:PIN domain-containing protein [Candidatus Hydrogenedentota bacterium]
MTTLFADTSFFVAFFSANDEKHDAVVRFLRDDLASIVTRAWVLCELGALLARGRYRERYVPFVRGLQSSPRVEIVAADIKTFEKALELYAARPEKSWSLVDCPSSRIMARLA